MSDVELDEVGYLSIPGYVLFGLVLGIYCLCTGRTSRFLSSVVLGSFVLRALCYQATTCSIAKLILVTSGMLFISLAKLNARSLLGGVVGGSIMVALTFILPPASLGTPEVLFYLSVVFLVYGYFFVGQEQTIVQQTSAVVRQHRTSR